MSGEKIVLYADTGSYGDSSMYTYGPPYEAVEMIVCPYCGSIQERKSNCEQCGAPLPKEVQERVRNVIVEVEKPVGLWAVIKGLFKR